jgi:hypothetical protein
MTAALDGWPAPTPSDNQDLANAEKEITVLKKKGGIGRRTPAKSPAGGKGAAASSAGGEDSAGISAGELEAQLKEREDLRSSIARLREVRSQPAPPPRDYFVTRARTST